MMHETPKHPHSQADNADIHSALADARLSPAQRGKRFFTKIGGSVKAHPWWSAGILAGGIGFCPICKYFAVMLLAGGMILALRNEDVPS